MTGSMAFAVPGDIKTVTGGYLYDLHLTQGLKDLGLDLRHMTWGTSFPHPTPEDRIAALEQLLSLPEACPALVDGLGYGALETRGLAQVRAPLFALVHHPLALEPGLEPDVASTMAAREKANLDIARHIFVTSPHTAKVLRHHYGVADHRITVAQPGFSPPTDRTPTAKSAPPLILSVGLLARRKGHDILLRALARITDLPWQADIVGRDHEPGVSAMLRSLIHDLGLSGRVQLSGEIPQEALLARYRTATLFALATRYEGYGIVFGEAMCHGLPIVSTRAGAVPETVATDAGLLVPPEDPEAFAAALRQLLDSPTLLARTADASLRAATLLPTWKDTAGLVRDRMASARDAIHGG